MRANLAGLRSAGRACEVKSEDCEEAELWGAEHMRYVSTAGAKDDKARRSFLRAVHSW